MSLDEKAMLVDIKFHSWGGYKLDKQVTEEVAVNHNSDSTMGRYNKQLVPREAFAGVYKVWNKTAADYRLWTLPWLDTGWRILSSGGYFKFTELMRKRQLEWDEAVEEFVEAYPGRIKEAKLRLNGLFKEDEYPKVEAIKSRFGFGWSFAPVPAAGDFRVSLEAGEVDIIKAQIESTQQDAIAFAMKDVTGRITGVVGHMAERLKAYGGGDGTFRNSLVDNVEELIDMLPALNITDDQELNAIMLAMKELLVSPVDLRISEVKRNETMEAANAILAQVSAFAA